MNTTSEPTIERQSTHTHTHELPSQYILNFLRQTTKTRQHEAIAIYKEYSHNIDIYVYTHHSLYHISLRNLSVFYKTNFRKITIILNYFKFKFYYF
jgi:hypothetical protein